MYERRRLLLWLLALMPVALAIGLWIAVRFLDPSAPFTVGPDDPPPGLAGEWSPDVLGLLVGADLSDDYTYPSNADRANKWVLIGPALLTFEDGAEFTMPADTPLWGRCPSLEGDEGGRRPSHCVVHLGLSDEATVAWIKTLDESRADPEGNPVLPESVVTLINFDRVDGALLYGRGGDIYPLADSWEWSGRARPDSGHPVFTTFDTVTGLVTRLEPAAFEG